MSGLLISVLTGLAVAVLVILCVARRYPGVRPDDHPRRPRSILLGRVSFGLGVLTAAAVAVAWLFAPVVTSEADGAARAGQFDPQSFYLIALATGIAALVTGAIALRQGDRRWLAWAGPGIGAAVVGLWAGTIVWVMLNPY